MKLKKHDYGSIIFERAHGFEHAIFSMVINPTEFFKSTKVELERMNNPNYLFVRILGGGIIDGNNFLLPREIIYHRSVFADGYYSVKFLNKLNELGVIENIFETEDILKSFEYKDKVQDKSYLEYAKLEIEALRTVLTDEEIVDQPYFKARCDMFRQLIAQ